MASGCRLAHLASVTTLQEQSSLCPLALSSSVLELATYTPYLLSVACSPGDMKDTLPSDLSEYPCGRCQNACAWLEPLSLRVETHSRI